MKSRARAQRWTEEVLLVREEKRRVLEFLEWRHDWWIERAHMRAVSDPALADGLQAYAYEQAKLQDSLSKSFLAIWGDPTDEQDVEMEQVDDHGGGGGSGAANKDKEDEDGEDGEEDDIDEREDDEDEDPDGGDI